MFYVYEDWTAEAVPRCFYVGKGTKTRVGQRKRNKKHSNVANKHGFRREIVFMTTNETAAFDLEKVLIQERKTHVMMSGIGCNFTLGGEGQRGNGRRWSDEERQRHRELLKTKDLTRSEATKKKLSELKKGELNPLFGKKHSTVTLDKMRSSQLGKVRSPEARKRMSEARKGKLPWNKGIKKKENENHVTSS